MSMLETYVRGWRESADAVIALGSDLSEADWSTPTDCPGWTVKDVVAHVAHLEVDMCRADQGSFQSSGAQEVVSAYTEAGVAERRDRSPAELIAELSAAVEQRWAQLADLPEHPQGAAPITPAGVAWTWDTLLRNRVIDVWVHEQDIRRAVGRRGGLDGTGAQIAAMTFSFAMPYVLGKRVRPPAGSIVRWDVSGEVPLDLAVQVGEDGRAQRVDVMDHPTATLSMSTEAFTVLAAGRRTPDQLAVTIVGDQELGRATLAAMAVTP